ncbi:MAG: hypothetical protein KH355_08105 [Clostridiales bacterium]|nr:hypothetical protein [Clostridiales bacterium]
MKKNKYRWLLFGVIILLLMSMNGILIYSVLQLQGTVKNMNKIIRNNQSNLESQIENISDTFEKTLIEQNRAISSFEFIYGDLNAKTGKIEVTVRVIPKESQQSTSLIVTYEETEGKYSTAPATRKGENLYEAQLKIPYNKDYHIGVLIKENNKTIQEYLDWIYNIESQLQLQVTGAYLDGDYNYSADNGLKVSGTVHLDVYNPSDSNPITGVEDNYIRSVNAHLYVDGEEIAVIPMEQDENTTGGNEYVCEVDQKLEFLEGQQFQLAVEIEDSLGFKYKTYALQGVADPTGAFNIDSYNYGYVEINP